ncbi:MAG: choice-of-anchor M domain-containing protein [Kofleriaceae bacterium]
MAAALAVLAVLAGAAGCGDNLGPAGDDVLDCPHGYVEQGETCVDLDECAADDPCDPRATCTNTEGSFACTCPAGWTGDGTACAPEPCTYRYTEGHGDMYASWDESEGLRLGLRSALEPGSGELVYDPWKVCIVVPRSTYEEIVSWGGRPPGAGWDPIGVPAGQSFWYLSELAIDGTPWFGLASDPSAVGGVPGGVFGQTLALSLEVDPPAGAQLSVWSSVSDPEAPPFEISTAIGLSTMDMITGSHAHLNWAFTRPGEYFVRAVVSGTLVAGGERASPPAVYRFIVEE